MYQHCQSIPTTVDVTVGLITCESRSGPQRLSLTTGESLDRRTTLGLSKRHFQSVFALVSPDAQLATVKLNFFRRSIRRWQLTLVPDKPTDQSLEEHGESTLSSSPMVTFFQEYTSDFSSPSYSHDLLTFGAVWLFRGAYGGVHALAAWHHAFPSASERFIWLILCVLLCLLAIIVVAVIQRCSRGEQMWKMYCGIEWIVPILVPFLYFVARIYVVAESFASLRSVPTGVYAVVLWGQWIPHV
ncbi:hypothetical protein B0J14DRAFT_214937 [Halenospora varia]|nr:hypothetical protein B0J14DRAFT_214937 [Halenospora varia]